MPGGGAKPGERRGGRRLGARNKSTIERERVAAEIAARTVADAKSSGKKLAKEVLEDFMNLFAGLAAYHQPLPRGLTDPNRDPNDDKFVTYARLAVDSAHMLAKFQSPTFKAVEIVDQTPGQSKPATVVDAKVIDMNDAQALARIYRARITQVR